MVYFLNPPQQTGKGDLSVIVKPSGNHENLWLIEHRLFFPYRIKFRMKWLFHWLMKWQIRKILARIERPLDIVWSFDMVDLYPLRFFNTRLFKIFHPVDEPLNQAAIDAAEGAQVIISVTNEILEKYRQYPAPKYFINHGVASNFLLSVDLSKSERKPVHVGFSGNLIRGDIDRTTLIIILDGNPDIVFDFWGSYDVSHSNIGGTMDVETVRFIDQLKSRKNVLLHGVIPSDQLALSIHVVDAFLICYDVERDQSKGTNYHKVLEYLSTGKVIVSNNITTYNSAPELVQMVKERTGNDQLPVLFKKVIANLGLYNSPECQEKRITFAADNTYSKQIDRIERLLETMTVAQDNQTDM